MIIQIKEVNVLRGKKPLQKITKDNSSHLHQKIINCQLEIRVFPSINYINNLDAHQTELPTNSQLIGRYEWTITSDQSSQHNQESRTTILSQTSSFIPSVTLLYNACGQKYNETKYLDCSCHYRLLAGQLKLNPTGHNEL